MTLLVLHAGQASKELFFVRTEWGWTVFFFRLLGFQGGCFFKVRTYSKVDD